MFFWFSVHLSHPHKRNVLGTPWRNPLKFGKNIHVDSRSSDIVIQPYVCPILPWTQSWTMDLGKFGYSCLQGIEVMVLGFSSVDFLIDVDHIGSCFTFGFSSYLFSCPFSVHLYCICLLHLVYLSLCFSVVVLSVFILHVLCSCVCSPVLVCSLCSWFVPPQLYGLSSIFVLQFPGFSLLPVFCSLAFWILDSSCQGVCL